MGGHHIFEKQQEIKGKKGYFLQVLWVFSFFSHLLCSWEWKEKAMSKPIFLKPFLIPFINVLPSLMALSALCKKNDIDHLGIFISTRPNKRVVRSSLFFRATKRGSRTEGVFHGVTKRLGLRRGWEGSQEDGD